MVEYVDLTDMLHEVVVLVDRGIFSIRKAEQFIDLLTTPVRLVTDNAPLSQQETMQLIDDTLPSHIGSEKAEEIRDIIAAWRIGIGRVDGSTSLERASSSFKLIEELLCDKS